MRDERRRDGFAVERRDDGARERMIAAALDGGGERQRAGALAADGFERDD